MSQRQRIEGTLHRSLPATLTIRASEPGQADDGLLRLRLSASSEEPYLRSSYWDEPWIEILGHKDGEVDLTRLNDGAPLLANHDRFTAHGNTPLAGIGAVERAWLEGGRIMADVVISRREALADLRQDIADGLVRNVSIGYQINERTLVKANGEGMPDEYRCTSWTPHEISTCDIPADATIGIGRAIDAPDPANSSAAAHYRVVDLPDAGPAGQHPPLKGKTMSDVIDTAPAAAPVADTRSTITVTDNGGSLIAAERARMKEINAMARTPELAAAAARAIEDGTTVDAFRKIVLDGMIDKGALRPAESAEIGMGKKDLEQFSFCRAMLAASDPLHAAKLAPFEYECSRAAQDKRGDSRGKDRDTAMTIPVDVLMRGMMVDHEMAGSVARNLVQRAMQRGGDYQYAQRDLLVGTPTAGGNLVATELLSSSFIELLRNAMILDRVGATFLTGLNGNFAVPAQTGGASTFWVAENGATTESAQTVGQVTLTPKTVGTYTDYSRRLLLQSSIDVEMFVRADLAAQLGLEMQRAAINGSGASNEPLGLLNISGIGAVVGGTNGLAPTYDHMVDLEGAIGNANAEVGAFAYLTNSKVRGKLRKTQEFASTNGKAVWTSGGMSGVGDVLGYDAFVTNSVPSNLTKGTSSGVCSAVVGGVFSQLLIGMWGGLDIMLDPYTGAISGTKRVVALQDVDMNVRYAAAFAAMKDALTA